MFRPFIHYVVFTITFALFCVGTLAAKETVEATVVQGLITLAPVQADPQNPEKIHPLSQVQIKAKVKNSGASASAPAKLLVRFQLPKPLQDKPNSILFETETVDLPRLDPGEEKEIVFTKTHQYPTVNDFIRYDWPMRHYEAVLKLNDGERVIGTRAMTFSAYYYQAPGKELPNKVPAQP